MSQQRTVQLFFQNSVLRYAGLGLAMLIIASLGISLLLARNQAESELQESARSTAHAFGDRILDGDIKSVEPQIRELLKIQKNEIAKILKSDLTRAYEPFNELAPSVKQCPFVGKACLEGVFGQAHILFPISLEPSGKNPYRYLYLSKDVHLNWYFLVTIFTIFSVGYFGLVMAFIRISKVASQNLGKEILNWSERLRANPKDLRPLSEPPFSELLPLKYAIEGLNDQIEKFEQTATDRAKFLILRGIGHDLLTPVSRLQLYLAALEKNIDREQNADTLSEMKESLKRVTTFASQVKTLKESSPSKESTELMSTLSEEVKTLQRSEQILEKSISLEFSSHDFAIRSPFSRTEISRILLNLVQNAADASSKGSVIRVEAGVSNGATYFSVSDSGCGISDEFKSRVFDPDFTLKPGTGTGLGLAIVKYLCDQREASIELDTKANQGTRIKITTPAFIGESMYKILMVDDDAKNLKATQIFLKSAGYEVLTTTSPTEAIELTKADEFALALLDYQMPEMKGDALALMIRQVNPHQQIAMYSCDLSREAVKFSMKAGALDFIEKTIAPEELLKLIESYCNKYDILWRTVRPTKDKSEIGKLIESVGMIGQSKATADIAAIIHKVAGVDTSVLIHGESGTGKELVARAIHKLSPRSAKGHFVALNCGAFPKDLLESELFGHVKGSFSGAVNDQMGKFEVANNGTLFLDEIGDMPLDLQVKLLRVLQEREFVPVGGKFPKKVNVRILTATNKNIDDMVVKGIFREDLMYRIKVFEIELQPLRNRIEDIEPLVAYFTEFFNKKNNTNKFFQKRTIELLKKNIWSGNVRELQGTVERHMITSSGNLIRPEDLDLKFYEATSPVVSGITMDQYWNQMADDEIRFLQNTIEKTGGNKAEAARRLNITPRHLQHLLNKEKDSKSEGKVL